MARANLNAFRKNAISPAELQQKLSPKKTYEKKQDERMWYPERDDAGNASTVIRFLPSIDGVTFFQTYYDHYFEGKPGQWFIDKCRTTLDDGKCPVCESNSTYWKAANHDRDLVADNIKARTKKHHHVANILVIKDPANPSNEGKVFLFKFGNYLRNMILDAACPKFEEDMAIQAFDFWNGADFNLRIHKTGSGKRAQTSYENSKFSAPSALFDGDVDKLGALIERLYDVEEFKFEKEMNTYEAQLQRFNRVTGEGMIAEQVPSAGTEAMAPQPEMPPQELSEPTPEAISTLTEADDDVDIDAYSKYFDD